MTEEDCDEEDNEDEQHGELAVVDVLGNRQGEICHMRELVIFEGKFMVSGLTNCQDQRQEQP